MAAGNLGNSFLTANGVVFQFSSNEKRWQFTFQVDCLVTKPLKCGTNRRVLANGPQRGIAQRFELSYVSKLLYD